MLSKKYSYSSVHNNHKSKQTFVPPPDPLKSFSQVNVVELDVLMESCQKTVETSIEATLPDDCLCSSLLELLPGNYEDGILNSHAQVYVRIFNRRQGVYNMHDAIA